MRVPGLRIKREATGIDRAMVEKTALHVCLTLSFGADLAEIIA